MVEKIKKWNSSWLLRNEMYGLLTRGTRAPTPFEQQELEKRGWVFVNIESKSLNDLEKEAESAKIASPFEYVHGGSDQRLRTDRWSPIVIGIYTTEPILGSLGKSQGEQIKMIDKHLKNVPGAKSIMLTASGYAQAHKAYFEKTGKELIQEGMPIRCLEETSDDFAVNIERGQYGLRITDSRSDREPYPNITSPQALPVAVFPK